MPYITVTGVDSEVKKVVNLVDENDQSTSDWDDAKNILMAIRNLVNSVEFEAQGVSNLITSDDDSAREAGVRQICRSKEVIANNDTLCKVMEKWGNTFDRGGRSRSAVLMAFTEFRSSSGTILKFCRGWVQYLSGCYKPGFYDDRDKVSCQVCNIIDRMFKDDGIGGAVEDSISQLAAKWNTHRTIIQSLTAPILMMYYLYADACEADNEVGYIEDALIEVFSDDDYLGRLKAFALI